MPAEGDCVLLVEARVIVSASSRAGAPTGKGQNGNFCGINGRKWGDFMSPRLRICKHWKAGRQLTDGFSLVVSRRF